jgi:DNA mismatch repair protein MutS2
MKFFTTFANKKTIFFIDEFGTGTEPQFGGAIAEGILIALNKSGAFGVVTTHYGNSETISL